MSTRDDIAAALAGVDRLDVKAFRPDVLHPGATWPQWQRATWVTGCAIERTWWVLTVLPAGAPAVTAQAADELIPLIGDALLDLGVVDSVEPVEVPAQSDNGGGTLPALRFTVRITE